MWKALLNKYVLGGVVLIALLAIIAMQELRYKNTLLTLQDTENSLSTTSHELSEALSNIDTLNTEIERQNASNAITERVSKDVAVQLKAIRLENNTLKKSLAILKKQEVEVEEYLNTDVPDSITDRLRK